MSDTNVVTPPVETPKVDPLFAGKFKTPEALETGYLAVRKTIAEKHGFEAPADNAKLVGEGGSFKDHLALEEAYKKAERLIGVKPADDKKPEAPTPALTPTGELKIEAAAEPVAEEPADVPTILTKAGLKLEDLAEQFTSNGDLTPEQYDAIRKARPSLTKADIKLVAEGMAAKTILANQTKNQIKVEAVKLAGGEQQLATLLNEATLSKFMTPAEIKDAGRRLADPSLAIGTVRDLAARYEAHAGRPSTIVTGDARPQPRRISTIAEFREATRRAEQGDEAAARAIMETPLEAFSELS